MTYKIISSRVIVLLIGDNKTVISSLQLSFFYCIQSISHNRMLVLDFENDYCNANVTCEIHQAMPFVLLFSFSHSTQTI